MKRLSYLILLAFLASSSVFASGDEADVEMQSMDDDRSSLSVAASGSVRKGGVCAPLKKAERKCARKGCSGRKLCLFGLEVSLYAIFSAWVSYVGYNLAYDIGLEHGELEYLDGAEKGVLSFLEGLRYMSELCNGTLGTIG